MQQLKEGDHYYLDKTGLLVFTEKYLKQRGTCCGNGCRHCPYDYKNVSEPARSKLLALKQDEKNEG